MIYCSTIIYPFFLYYIINFLISQYGKMVESGQGSNNQEKICICWVLRENARPRPPARQSISNVEAPLREKYKIKDRGQTTTKKFAYGVWVLDSGLGSRPRPANYTTSAASLSIVKLHKKKDCAICTINFHYRANIKWSFKVKYTGSSLGNWKN